MTSPPADDPADYAPIPRSALGPALNDQGYYVGRVERNLYYVTDGVYQSAFLTTPDGVVVFDAPPSIGGNIRRAVDEIAAANGVTNKVTHLVYSHHHADHGGAASLFENVVRIGHEETRRLLVRDDDLGRPLPDDELMTELTAISGIGPWTVQGALLIALQREDVVLPGDLALRKAIQAVYRLDHLPNQQEVLAIAEKWRPYRSLATSYLFSAAFAPAEALPVARHRSA